MLVNERTLCIVVCGAGPATHVGQLVQLAQLDGWKVRLVATPMAMSFIDAAALAAQSGVELRSDYRAASEAGPRSSAADAIVVAPATYNSINKLAAGINDTYALNVVAEGIGRGKPVVLMPFVNAALAARRPFIESIRMLREERVRVVLGPGEWQPHEPGSGGSFVDSFPWHLSLRAIANMSGTAASDEQ